MILFSSQAVALNCEKQPTCEELGYSTQNNPNCLDDGYLICPFDSNYKKCVNFNCESLGFTQSEKSDWCADIATCKGDKSYTLCQTPCLAWDYETLSSLASSGKCKVVSMKNDITIPKNESLTLAENTVIDGGNHTLNSSSNQSNYRALYLNNNTGFKNIKIRHTHTDIHSYLRLIYALNSTNTIFLENMEIVVSSTDPNDHSAPVMYQGIYEISGKFTIDVQGYHIKAFYGSTANFKNAQISLKLKNGKNEVADEANLNLTNSVMNADYDGVLMTHHGTATFKNSEVNLKGDLFYCGAEKENKNINLILEESNFTSTSTTYSNSSAIVTMTLKGNAEHPSVLSITYKEPALSDKTSIVATNTTDKFILNGTTYRPKQIGTTLLSEIPNSPIWEAVQ